jgi:argininosuccinate lyase
MSERWLAFIESNTSGTGRLFARAAAAQGLRPILLSADPTRYPYVAEDGIATQYIDTQDEQALVDACRRLAEDAGLAGVASSSEYFIATAAGLAARFGLPGPRQMAITRCRDKYMQRVCLHAAGVGVPAFRAADSVAGARGAADELGYPVVVKPINGSGSIGVKLCGDADAVRDHATTLLNQQQNERGQPVPQRILVEELAVGQEYSVELFNGGIVGITQKYLGSPPYFIEVGHDFPARLAAGDEQAIAQTVRRSLDALDLGWGPIHVELRVTKSGPRIIEVNPRLAGGFIPELVRLATGIDMIAETVRLVTGGTPLLQRTNDEYAAIRFIVLDQDGTLVEVGDLDAAARLAHVVAVKRYARASNRIRCFGDFRDRIGHVIVCASTPEAARASADAAQRMIQVIIRPE